MRSIKKRYNVTESAVTLTRRPLALAGSTRQHRDRREDFSTVSVLLPVVSDLISVILGKSICENIIFIISCAAHQHQLEIDLQSISDRIEVVQNTVNARYDFTSQCIIVRINHSRRNHPFYSPESSKICRCQWWIKFNRLGGCHRDRKVTFHSSQPIPQLYPVPRQRLPKMLPEAIIHYCQLRIHVNGDYYNPTWDEIRGSSRSRLSRLPTKV